VGQSPCFLLTPADGSGQGRQTYSTCTAGSPTPLTVPCKLQLTGGWSSLPAVAFCT